MAGEIQSIFLCISSNKLQIIKHMDTLEFMYACTLSATCRDMGGFLIKFVLPPGG